MWHEPSDEPLCKEKFDFGFEKEDSGEGMRKLIIEEVESFRRMVRPQVTTPQPPAPPVRQNSGGPRRQETLPLPVPTRDEIMLSPSVAQGEVGGGGGAESVGYAMMNSPVQQQDELERELMFGKNV